MFPTHIDLPNGFRPEGIVIGKGTTFYVGSIPTGALYRGDLRTGQGEVITPGAASGSASIGLAIDDHERVYVAGGGTGQGQRDRRADRGGARDVPVLLGDADLRE